jgi:hypothetical protein
MTMRNILLGLGLFSLASAACADPITAGIAAFTGLSAGAVTAGLYGIGGALLGKKLAGGGAPQLKAPTVMPLADDQAAQAARRRQIAEMQARGGRASTILSGDDKLGG